MTHKSTLGTKRLVRAERFVADLDEELVKEGDSIDANIREAVTVFQAFGLYTRGSCGGHIDDASRGAGPYIDVIPLPEKQWWKLWQREDAARRQRREFLKKHDKPIDTYTKRERNFLDRNLKEMHLLDKPMSKFTFKLITLLERFYKNRKTPIDARLILWSPLNRQIMIISQGARAAWSLPAKKRRQRVQRYQKELLDFVTFIRKLVLQGKIFKEIDELK